MLKKVFVPTIIIAILFPWQLSLSEIRPKEKIIATSPDSFGEFLLKATKGLKSYFEKYSYPKKGEFETSDEYYNRCEGWKLMAEIGNSVSYKATGLFPVQLVEYNADFEEFSSIELKVTLSKEPEVETIYRSQIPGVIASDWGKSSSFYFESPSIRCKREKARMLREKSDTLRCDIVFILDYSPASEIPLEWKHRLNWNLIDHWLIFYLRSIKFYSLETGEVLFQAPSTSIKK